MAHAMKIEKIGSGSYRLGHFRIEKRKNRWHVVMRRGDFSTLGGAMAWCRQQAEKIQVQSSGATPG
jgi:hypothetical protein